MRPIKILQSITDRHDDSLNIFFKEISKIPLIDINKETELSRRVKDGDMSAANELALANLRFVISVAKQYQNKGIPLVDLIQEGIIGLIRAAQKYDESKGFRFISYAVWWIRQAIIKAISSQCRTVRTPSSQINLYNKIDQISNRFEQENNRLPSTDEIEELIDVDSDKVSISINAFNKSVSLDTKFSDDESGTLLDIIPDDSMSITTKLEEEDISKEMACIFDELSNRESDVIRMVFGFGMNPMQKEEIANRFGITSERVRQIQKEALEKIRKNHYNLLKDIYYGRL